MLEEPSLDPRRAALDKALAKAIANRVAAGSSTAPDVEALALRHALAHAVTPAEEALVHAVWGRIAAQGSPPLVVSGAAASLLAADRFGLAMRPAASAEAALAEAAGGTRALIDIGGVWWARLLAQPDVRVIAALPDDQRSLPRALMIARAQPGPTGDDRTFWVTDSPAPDDRIVSALGEAGLAATPLAAHGGLKLFVLAGYVQAEDGRLASAPGTLNGVIGAAPLF